MTTPREVGRPVKTERGGESLAELAAAVGRGDRAAFERLHERLGRGLVRFFFARNGGRSEEAEELAQRAWTAVWGALRDGRYDPNRGAVTTFVYAISYRTWFRHLRQTAASREAAEPMDGVAASMLGEEDPSQLAAFCELLEAVRGALAATGPGCLTEEERRLVVAAGGGRTDRALAAELGVAASTVHARRTAALAKLRRMLAARGFRDEQPSAQGARGE